MTVISPESFDPESAIGKARAALRRARFLAPQVLIGWLVKDGAQAAIWAPVAIGAGAGLYFGLKTEPFWQIAVLVMLVAGLASLQRGVLGKISFIGFLCALGFVAADWRTARVEAPILERDLGIRQIEGRIISVEARPDSKRYVVALRWIENVGEDETPDRARITWRGEGFDAKAGDFVGLRAGLGPPPPPAAPGTFDFARQLYFQRIGAVGYAVSAPAVITDRPPPRFGAISASIETLRANLFQRITKAAPGQGGAIVAAVVTGKRDAITSQSQAALRDAGLAHLLAISGLHMGLATGLIFFAVRGLLAAIEPLALKYPIKKWAAAAALLSGLAYLILSGGGWSARRAFIMTAIIFTAILVDRRALSLRNVAIAATVILLMTPEALFHPGFQMSFAAVTALIAAYEWMSRRADPFRSFSLPAKLRRYAIGLAITDTIAALATAPYALYHFNRVALYSLPANILAMPLMGFWIMPMAVTALLLTPLGLDGWAWSLSANGVETILAIATEVSNWPGAVSLTPQWPLAAMLALTLGGLWLCLARSPLRLLGLAAIPVAAIVAKGAAPPHVFVAASGLNAGVLMSDENPGLAVFTRRRDRFATSVWREAAGLDPLKSEALLMRDVGACDQSGCVLVAEANAWVSFIEDRLALEEDCARADLVVAFFPVSAADWRACKAPLIDRRSVWKRGAHAVIFNKHGVANIKTVAETRGDRPWTGDH